MSKPAKKKAPAKKPTPRTRKVAAPAPAPTTGAKPKQMYLLTEQELDNLTKYVVSLSRHNLSGEEYLAVLGAVQAARQRPAGKAE